jgi:hypothetical protein
MFHIHSLIEPCLPLVWIVIRLKLELVTNLIDLLKKVHILDEMIFVDFRLTSWTGVMRQTASLAESVSTVA